MKHFLAINILLFINLLVFCQPFNKTIASARVYADSFNLRRLNFLSSKWDDLYVIDTIKNTKDSFVVNFKNSKGFIKQRIDLINDTGCKKESFTNYIDSRNLTVFSEHWTFFCWVIDPDPNDYNSILDTYRRFEYDKLLRVRSEFVKDQSTGTWRYDYWYDQHGNRGHNSTMIPGNQFWTN